MGCGGSRLDALHARRRMVTAAVWTIWIRCAVINFPMGIAADMLGNPNVYSDNKTGRPRGRHARHALCLSTSSNAAVCLDAIDGH